MGIEPTRAVLTEMKNKRFGAIANPKCDWRVNFRGMRVRTRLRRDTFVCEVPSSLLFKSQIAPIDALRSRAKP
jgi:hypothetical protein